MYDKVVRFLEQPVIQGLRNQMIAILAFVAVLAYAWAVRMESREAVSTGDGPQWSDRHYAQLWVSREGVTTGARAEYNRIVFERAAASGTWQQVAVPVTRTGQHAQDAVWAASRGGNEIAWADEAKLYYARLDYGRKTVEPQASILQKGAKALNFLDGDTVQVVLKDSRVRVWEVGKQEVRDEPRIRFTQLEQVAGDGEYLAGASGNRMVLYRTVDGLPRMIDQADGPPGQFRMVMPGAGQIAALWSGGVLTRGAKLNTPGKVSAAAIAPDNGLVVAGDFPGLRHCTPQECRSIAPAEGVMALASNDRYVAYSGPLGTGVRPFRMETIYTARGELALWVAGVAFGLCCTLAALGVLLRLLMLVMQKDKMRPGGLPQSFRLPDGLLRALREGRVVLWAGSGLSAQAGLPTRTAFLRLLIEGAETERWIGPAGIQMLQAKLDHGLGEECAATLADGMGGSGNPELQSFYRMMYRRITLLTPLFNSLAKLPFAAAITTNYDTALERLGPEWEAGAIPMPFHPLSAIRSHQFFLWKVYGDVQCDSPLLLSRIELAETAQKIASIPSVIHSITHTRSLLFLGSSLEGLIEDLKALGVRQQHGIVHYAFAAAGSRSWKKQADVLMRDFGVEVSVVDEGMIEKALQDFIDQLAAAMLEPERQVARQFQPVMPVPRLSTALNAGNMDRNPGHRSPPVAGPAPVEGESPAIHPVFDPIPGRSGENT